MKRYGVKWRKSALDDLAEIWLQSADRDAVTRAAREIESRLENDPVSAGRELSEGLRSLTCQTLRVIFYVVEGTSIVRIVSAMPVSVDA